MVVRILSLMYELARKWSLTKVRLKKFNYLPRHSFHLHLKETE